jgi:hypothetical protein
MEINRHGFARPIQGGLEPKAYPPFADDKDAGYGFNERDPERAG